MSKRIIRGLPLGLSTGCLILILTSPAGAFWNVGVFGALYGPNIGEVNEDLDVINASHGTNLKLRNTLIYGGVVRYSLTPHFALRLEMAGFSLHTSGTYEDEGSTHKIIVEARAASVIVGGVYRFSFRQPPSSYQETTFPYLGLGLGRISTKYKKKEVVSGSTPSVTILSDEDQPAALQVLVGVEITFPQYRNFVVVAEIRHLWAVADVAGSSLDWSGLVYGVGVQGRF